ARPETVATGSGEALSQRTVGYPARFSRAPLPHTGDGTDHRRDFRCPGRNRYARNAKDPLTAGAYAGRPGEVCPRATPAYRQRAKHGTGHRLCKGGSRMSLLEGITFANPHLFWLLLVLP